MKILIITIVLFLAVTATATSVAAIPVGCSAQLGPGACNLASNATCSLTGPGTINDACQDIYDYQVDVNCQTTGNIPGVSFVVGIICENIIYPPCYTGVDIMCEIYG